MRSHEMIYVFSKSGAFYNRIDISGNFPAFNGNQITKNKNTIVYSSGMPNGWKKNSNDGTTRCVVSVINVGGSAKKGNHPTEKPEALYRFLIERYCPADGTMLDPTAGSFNSVFTALAMGRDAIGIEKDKGFFLKAKARAINYNEPQ